jgi:hypothetical protein
MGAASSFVNPWCGVVCGLVAATVAGCTSASSLAPDDDMETTAPDAASADVVLQTCNDGTGATDCCPVGTQSGGMCAAVGVSCWTECLFDAPDAGEGLHGQFVCTPSGWTAGHGLFPCARDGG